LQFLFVQWSYTHLKKDNIAKGDVTGLIGITGEANGTISVAFDRVIF